MHIASVAPPRRCKKCITIRFGREMFRSQGTSVRKLCVRVDVIRSLSNNILPTREDFGFVRPLGTGSHIVHATSFLGPSRRFGDECYTAMTKSHESTPGATVHCVNQRPRDWTSDSVEPCETPVCFLHIQVIGTKVRLPKMHRIPPDVDLGCSRSQAKCES